MAQLIIGNFANGLDLRKSHDTAPPGSLRVLRNVFINDGGEIEKRKAWARNAWLTAYGQTPAYKGKISGPHLADVIGSDRIFFRHRHDSLPPEWGTTDAGWSALSIIGDVRPITVYAMRSEVPLTDYGAFFRGNSLAHYASKAHLIESFWANDPTNLDNRHFEISLSAAGEPLSEVLITDNDNRTAVAVFRTKAYFAQYKTVAISAVADPGDMAGTGSGAIDVRTQGKSIGRILGFGEYFGELCIIGTRGVQFWQMDPDPDQNQYLRWTPAQIVGERSIIGYGDGDIVFMGDDGIRSMTARDSSNIATLLDIGSPIDRLVREFVAQAGEYAVIDGDLQSTAPFVGLNPSVIHPETGQLWMFAGTQVFVYANHPGAKVRAWSIFDLPEVSPGNIQGRVGLAMNAWCADVAPVARNVMIRNYADEIYIYGGPDGDTYDGSEAEVITPHMDAGRPGTEKYWRGIDMSCSGTWTVYLSFDPSNIEWERVAVIQNGSIARLHGMIPIGRSSYHIAIRAICTSSMAARISQIVLYHDQEDEK